MSSIKFHAMSLGGSLLTSTSRISQLQPIDPVLGPSMEEVSQTIASVTLAITMMQTSPIEGYSFLSEESIRGYATGSPPEQGCINAGPPMLVPLDHGDHLVLLIAHAVDRGDVEILVMDPRPQSTINGRWIRFSQARLYADNFLHQKFELEYIKPLVV